MTVSRADSSWRNALATADGSLTGIDALSRRAIESSGGTRSVTVPNAAETPATVEDNVSATSVTGKNAIAGSAPGPWAGRSRSIQMVSVQAPAESRSRNTAGVRDTKLRFGTTATGTT